LRFGWQSKILRDRLQVWPERQHKQRLAQDRSVIKQAGVVSVRKHYQDVPEPRKGTTMHQLAKLAERSFPGAHLNAEPLVQFA